MKKYQLPAALAAVLSCIARGAELKINLPLERTAYQTNELIELAIVRSAPAALAAGELTLKLAGDDGSALSFTFPVEKADPEGGAARAVEHLRVNGWLLRPAAYTIEAACDGATATAKIEVFSHVRRSSFRLINWGRAKDKEALPQGEDNLGYNLFYGNPGEPMNENFIRAGVDWMSNCTMSGGHQMDLRQECDWSDPYVIRGGTRRVAHRALMDRTRPNIPGVHFYDEPGLTWTKDPATGELTPHAVPSQAQAFEAAFGGPAPDDKKVDPSKAEDAARWNQWARWKLGFMDAAWKDAQFGVSQVRPDFLSVTQSQYGWTAFTDGYYFNVVRSLPVISGHGGYHDFGPGYFNPSLFLEMARARDYKRPNWYLPTWYGNTTPDEFRLEQYLSFQTNIQGMMSPPDLEPGGGKSAAIQGIVESNKLMARLGTIFTTMPVTRPPVAMLFSLSDSIHMQTLNRSRNYAHESPQGHGLTFTYLAGKVIQQPLMVVVEEDILDGTLAAEHKAVILTSLTYLDPPVVAALERFAKGGGLVLITADCKVKIAGAIDLGVAPHFADQAKIDELVAAKNYQEAGKLSTLRHALAGAQPLADALKRELEKEKIQPLFTCDQPGIVATRHAAADVEYFFAVNATHDPEGNPMLGTKAVTAKIGLPGNGRYIYDAIHGGAAKEFLPEPDRLRAELRFGPGQMRVFARTTQSIAGVKAVRPIVRRDFTQAQAPLKLELNAMIVDPEGAILSGSFPMRVRVVDPLGGVRYDLYRATDAGVLRLTLPLAINEPAGEWKVRVGELLANTESTAAFTFTPIADCPAVAGEAMRAIHLRDDRDTIFRFFRTHQQVTIVKGTQPWHAAAAERLTKILDPWGVRCAVVDAAAVNKPRVLSEKAIPTWVGLGFGRVTQNEKQDVSINGFALDGPALLLGTPEDNPLIKFLADKRFVPYAPKAGEMPGPSRGYVAWQRDGIGAGQESITLIAHDESGMKEAVGSLYEFAAGMEPLTPFALARASTIAAASARPVPEPATAWSLVLPDRVDALKVDGAKLIALTHDGTLAEVSPTAAKTIGAVAPSEMQKRVAEMNAPPNAAATEEAPRKAPPERLVKFVATAGEGTAVAHWGGWLALRDKTGALKAARQFEQDITALAVTGENLIVGDADGRVTALKLQP